MRLIATAHGIVTAPAAAPNPARRSWLKRLGAVLSAAALARPALAGPTQVTGSQPFIGEIMLVGWNFATPGWLICNGQLVAISDYPVLFQLIGTTYGGNGTTNFALPDLRGRAPKHTGQGNGLSNYVRGQQGGSESLTLTTAVNGADSLTTVPRKVTFGVAADRSLVETTVVGTPLQTDYWQFVSTPTKRTLGGSVVTTASSGSPLFTYYDFTGAVLTPDSGGALSATQLPAIAAVQVSVTIDRTATASSQAVMLQTTVSLSNLVGGATT